MRRKIQMFTNRRNFIKGVLVAGGALNLGFKPNFEDKKEVKPVEKAAKPLRILILGGTGFIGPHQVRYALARGHKLTLFNRGKRNPHLFPDVEQLHGDRITNDYKSLAGREWDVVIDNPTSFPRWVREATQAIKPAKQYVFISTISVYADNSKPDMDENTVLATVADPTIEKITEGSYGGLKALSEKEAEKAYPGKATIIRPGLIVGPGDFSDRFSYWPVRIDRGGEILAPGDPTDPVQFIDARDLAEWCIRMVEESNFGIYNATGPRSPLTMAEMLYGIKAITTSDAKFTWVNTDFLEEQKVNPWSDMPVWIPPRGEYAGFARVSIKRALDKGLTFRPLADTSRDTLEWYKSRPAEQKAKMFAGLTQQRETEVLAAWHSKKKQG
jgi:2'-hydroxyisoflavone reductase